MSAPNDLTLAISTLGGRVDRICLPPTSSGIQYLVVWQTPRSIDVPPHLVRPDVTVLRLEGTGVAHSRNAALDAGEDEFLLFGDDDVEIDLAGVLRLRDAMAAHPSLSFATGRLARGDTNQQDKEYRLTRVNSAKTGTPELMVRVRDLRHYGIRFDPRFGLGGEVPISDEFVLVSDALRAGLKGRHFPIIIGAHPRESTGSNWSDDRILQARKVVILRVFGPFAFLARIGFALKHRRDLDGVRGVWKFIQP